MDSIIEKIHEEFKTSGERLLKSSKRYCSNVKKLELLDTSNSDFLTSIGFKNSKVVTDVVNENNKITKRNNEIDSKIKHEKLLSDRIIDLNKKYPEYKVVTLDTIKKVCNKYGLICSTVRHYTGDIPQKNINDLKLFYDKYKIPDNEKIYVCTESCYEDIYNAKKYKNTISLLKNVEFYEEDEIDRCFYVSYIQYFIMKNDSYKSNNDLLICAPPNDFNFEFFKTDEFIYAKNDDVLSKSKNGIKDPIVLTPLLGYTKYKDRDIVEPVFLLNTLWGIEKYDKNLNDNPFNNEEN